MDEMSGEGILDAMKKNLKKRICKEE